MHIKLSKQEVLYTYSTIKKRELERISFEFKLIHDLQEFNRNDIHVKNFISKFLQAFITI